MRTLNRANAILMCTMMASILRAHGLSNLRITSFQQTNNPSCRADLFGLFKHVQGRPTFEYYRSPLEVTPSSIPTTMDLKK